MLIFFLFTTATKTCFNSEPWMTKLRSVYKSILFHHKRWRVPRVTSRHPHCVLNDCGIHGLSGLDLGNNYLICTTMVITAAPPNDETNRTGSHNACPWNWKHIIRNWAKSIQDNLENVVRFILYIILSKKLCNEVGSD